MKQIVNGYSLRELTEQACFEDLMKHEVANFIDVHKQSLDMTLELKLIKGDDFINRNWLANEMNSNVQGLIKTRYPQFFRSLPYGCFCYQNEYYMILFKKLNGDFFPEYNHSRNSRRTMNQKAMFDGKPIVYVGYRTNSTHDNLDFINAVYISNNKIIWNSDLYAVARNESIIQGRLFTPSHNPKEEDMDIIVTPKAIGEKKHG